MTSDTTFWENVKPWRDAAERAGLDMAAFDARIASKKAYVDEHVANINYDRSIAELKNRGQE